jgi:hypothetical protein
MKPGAKHAGDRSITFSDFTGGLRITSSELLKDNELEKVENMELDKGMLKTVDGIVPVKDTGIIIDGLFWVPYNNTLLFSSGNRLYRTNLTSVEMIGELSGVEVPAFSLFDGKVLAASGGKLQCHDGAKLTTIAASCECDMVFARDGRVVTAKAGLDRLLYSGMGDVNNWFFKTTDQRNHTDLDAVYMDVGYKDGSDIVAIVPLANDILVFKSYGNVFRIVGEYPDWSVQEVSRNVECANKNTAIQVGNNVYFLGKDGFRDLRTVVEYGAVKATPTGEKINRLLLNEAGLKAALWHLPNKNQIWIKTQNQRRVFVYHYLWNAFTVRECDAEIRAVVSVGEKTYIAVGSTIGLLDEQAATVLGKSYPSLLKTKNLVHTRPVLIKQVFVNWYPLVDGSGELRIGKLNLPLVIENPGQKIGGNRESIQGNRRLISSNTIKTMKQRCNVRTDMINIVLSLRSGSVKLHSVRVEVADL